MFKWIVLVKKKTGMTRQQFIDYYEKSHVPLIREIAPSIKDHRRSYPVFDDPLLAGGDHADDDAFDAIAESIFESREDALAAMAAFMEPGNMARLRADEANFVEPGRTKFYIVETRGSPLP